MIETFSNDKYFKTTILSILVLILTACEDDFKILPDESNYRVNITNNLIILSSRVSGASEEITIGENLLARPSLNHSYVSKKAKAEPIFTLKLTAEIQPPIVEGETVQATSVSISNGHSVMVSYNMRGAPRLGAVDWVGSSTNKKGSKGSKGSKATTTKLNSSITFNDSDINSVITDGVNIYTSVATNAEEFEYPAALERLKIKYASVTLVDNSRIQLSSYAGTSVLPTKHVIYATSGNQGELVALDEKTLELLGRFPLHDARWVALDEANKRIVVVQGTPGLLSVFEEGVFPSGSMNLLNTFSFPGANVAESKSTVEISGGKAFIAAGSDGVQIMCLDNGQIIGSVAIPDPIELGLDPAVVVTNAVTVENNLMFISNGEAGVYVVQAENDFDENNCNQQELSELGQLNFSSMQSANHVALKNNTLYIAAGLGGVKVVEVTYK